MPSERHYSDAEVEAWIGEKYPTRGHRTGEMLRALLADRTRLQVDRAVLLAEVRAGRELLGTRGNARLTDTAQNIPWFADYGRARVATDVRLGKEVGG